jgi:hypothetical protein
MRLLTYPSGRALDYRDVPARMSRCRSRDQYSCVQSSRGFSWRGLDRLGGDESPSDPQNKTDLHYCKLLATIGVGSFRGDGCR